MIVKANEIVGLETVESAPSNNLLVARAAMLLAAGKVVDQEAVRKDIPGGYAGKVELTVTARIGSDELSESYEVNLTVGHDSQRAHSSAASAAEILAYLASKLNKTTRDAFYRDLADAFVAGNQSFGVSKDQIDEASEALKKLNRTRQIEVSGSVKAKIERV